MPSTPNSAFSVCTERRISAIVADGSASASTASRVCSSAASALVACGTNMATVSAKNFSSSASGTASAAGGTIVATSRPLPDAARHFVANAHRRSR